MALGPKQAGFLRSRLALIASDPKTVWVRINQSVGSGAIRGLTLCRRAPKMVAANKNLLKEVRRLAIKDELQAMRLRGRLVVVAPLVLKPAKSAGKGKG